MKQIMGDATYSGTSLIVPEYWQYNNKYKLSMMMKDLFTDNDDINKLATILYNKLKFKDNEDNDIIFGTIFLCNESNDNMIDFKYKDFTYVVRCLQQQQNIN